MKNKKDNKNEIEVETKISFKTMFKILFCKSTPTNDEITNKTFAILTSLIFYLIGYGILFVDLILVLGLHYYFIFEYDWSNVFVGILCILFLIIIIISLFLFSVLLVGTAKEQEKNDASKTITVFSAIVSFVALIVAVIALFK